MDSILSAIYTGDLTLSSQHAPASQEYARFREKCDAHYDDFYETLQNINPALAKRFNSILEEQLDLGALEDKKTFMDSFRLGARLMMEILQDDTSTPPPVRLPISPALSADPRPR